jgi:hypothetical protein
LGEESADANPQRFYMGVRLVVAMYLAFFPDEAKSLSGLETDIINDARERAELFYPRMGVAAGREAAGAMNIAVERTAQCWAGNPAACQ